MMRRSKRRLSADASLCDIAVKAPKLKNQCANNTHDELIDKHKVSSIKPKVSTDLPKKSKKDTISSKDQKKTSNNSKRSNDSNPATSCVKKKREQSNSKSCKESKQIREVKGKKKSLPDQNETNSKLAKTELSSEAEVKNDPMAILMMMEGLAASKPPPVNAAFQNGHRDNLSPSSSSANEKRDELDVMSDSDSGGSDWEEVNGM